MTDLFSLLKMSNILPIISLFVGKKLLKSGKIFHIFINFREDFVCGTSLKPGCNKANILIRTTFPFGKA